MKMLYDTIAEYISGDWGEESRSPTSTQPAFCIRAADVVPIEANDFSTIPERFVSSSSFSQRQLREGDIVIEKSGGSPTQSTGRVVYISKPLLIAKQNVICSNFCTAIRLKPNWNPYFVYQYWRHIYNSGVFFNYEGKTSGLKNLQLEVALKSIPIPDIDLPAQLRIAGVLGSLDEKIALKRKKITESEALAKTIYDYWFVQFDFPDKYGRPYKSSGGKMVWNEQLKCDVPKGWEIGNLSSLCTISSSQCNPSRMDQTEIEHYSIPAFDAGVFPAFDAPQSILSNKFIVPKSAILYSKLNAQFKRIWDPLHITETPIASSEFVVYLPKENLYRGYIYAVLNDERFFGFANSISSCSTGSRKRFTPETTYRYALAIPPREILIAFSRQYSAMLESIRGLRMLIDSATKQRDFLLPLLMNGQVVVK